MLLVGLALPPSVADAPTCKEGTRVHLAPEEAGPRTSDGEQIAVRSVYVSAGGSRGVVVWQHRKRTHRLQLLDKTGAPIGAPVVLDLGGSVTVKAVLATSAGFVLFGDRLEPDYSFTAWAWPLGADGALSGPPLAIPAPTGDLWVGPPVGGAVGVWARPDPLHRVGQWSTVQLDPLSLTTEPLSVPFDNLPVPAFAAVGDTLVAHLGARHLRWGDQVVELRGPEAPELARARVLGLSVAADTLYATVGDGEGPRFVRVATDGQLTEVKALPSGAQRIYGAVGGGAFRRTRDDWSALADTPLDGVTGVVAGGWTDERVVLAWEPEGNSVSGLWVTTLDCKRR